MNFHMASGRKPDGKPSEVQLDANGALKTSLTAGGLPYGADEMVITNVAAGPATITYKLASVTVKTRTFTYTNSGASGSDVLTSVVDS